MKNIFIAILLLICMVFSLAGCNSEEKKKDSLIEEIGKTRKGDPF